MPSGSGYAFIITQTSYLEKKNLRFLPEPGPGGRTVSPSPPPSAIPYAPGSAFHTHFLWARKTHSLPCRREDTAASHNVWDNRGRTYIPVHGPSFPRPYNAYPEDGRAPEAFFPTAPPPWP